MKRSMRHPAFPHRARSRRRGTAAGEAMAGSAAAALVALAAGLVLSVARGTSALSAEPPREAEEHTVAPSPEGPPDLLATFRQGPMAGVEEIVFAVRKLGDDPHYYANYGPTLEHSRWPIYHDGARLCRLDLSSGEVQVLLDDPRGGIRDPAVDHDGETIVFSYRPGGTEVFHLYRIRSDGSELHQLTDGAYDDIEPAWLPDGGIVFVSARCRRIVNCHTTDTAVLYRCDADGSNIRPLSSNNQPDNTPWPLPNGQILYTRWEYVDRNQESFHHLWTANPDGTRQTVFFGNMHPGIVMIDAKPIPGSPKVVASFSPGHGLREHDGFVALVDPRQGPDRQDAARTISHTADYRDPWAFAEDAFMAAQGPRIVLMDGQGRTQTVFELPPPDVEQGLQCHEPRPLIPRPREEVVAPLADWSRQEGRVILADVYQGRSMEGVRRGEIESLLVLETLPKPMNYTGGMEPLSYGGTFTLLRILGTVPVEPDGSAYFELPALRSLLFVALDAEERSVKRMQSFLTVMPGETLSCVGCHEPRTQTPHVPPAAELAALRREPSRITPFADVPEVIDYPRDIQPILNEHCLRCHDDGQGEGNLSLSGDRGPLFSISYFTMTARELVVDGRNSLGNRPPRSIGSGASRLPEFLDGSHHDASPTDQQRRLVRLWIDSGAPYPGTYAALGTGMIGGFEIIDRSIRLDRSDTEWPQMQAAMEMLERRCGHCHGDDMPLPRSPSHKIGPGGWGAAFDGAPPWIDLTADDLRRRWSRHLMYNLTRPEMSLILRAPLAVSAGGRQACGPAVFADTTDPDYQTLLAAIARTRDELHRKTRFDMPDFRPRDEYLRRMQRYGILPEQLAEDAAVDVYALERAYWESLWYRP